MNPEYDPEVGEIAVIMEYGGRIEVLKSRFNNPEAALLIKLAVEATQEAWLPHDDS